MYMCAKQSGRSSKALKPPKFAKSKGKAKPKAKTNQKSTNNPPAKSKTRVRFSFPKGNYPRLVLLGNSNVGKSSLTKLLLSHPRWYKGKIGKTAGSTVRLTIINDPTLGYHVIDLPGFGRMVRLSRGEEKYVQEEMIRYLDRDRPNIFLALVIISVDRLQDELKKWYHDRADTIPLNLEFIQLLNELQIPHIVVLNKKDKVNSYQLQQIRSDLETVLQDSHIELQGIDAQDGLLMILETSTKQKQGIKELKTAIRQRAGKIDYKKYPQDH